MVDAGTVTAEDLAANFFLEASDIGSNRAAACLPRLRELNKYVTVECRTEALYQIPDDVILAHNVVLLTRAPLDEQQRINALCRANGKAFYAADAFGYEGLLFVDLGAAHEYRTETGTGAKSVLSEPVSVAYPSLQEAVAVPWHKHGNKRFGPVSPCYVHAMVLAGFEGQHGRRATSADSSAVLDVASALFSANGMDPNGFTPHDATALAAVARAEVAPVCAVLGGVIGQEVVKFVSGKGAPIENHFCLDALTGEGKVFKSPPK